MSTDFLDQLRELWRLRRSEIADRHDRTLPLADYVVDRWEKARLLGFGEGTSIYDNSLVLGTVSVGRNTWIGPNTILDGSGGLSIGSYCSISAGVQIYSHDSVAWALTGGEAPYDYGRTVIEDRCYIGPNSIIAKGLTIGAGATVGAASVVLHDVAPGGRVAGAPARPLD